MARVGLTWDGQASFAAGAYPGLEEVPVDGCEEILNALVTEDGALQRRGGTSYKTTADTTAEINSVWDGFLVPGARTVFSDATKVYLLASDDQTPLSLLTSVTTGPGRWTEINHLLARPLTQPNQGTIALIGGAEPFTAISAGTAAATEGSPTVTGTGTAWTSVPSGSILEISGQRPVAIKNAVDATHITLADDWPAGSASGTYTIKAATTFAIPEANALVSTYPTYLAAMFGRLVVANGNRVSFTRFKTLNDGRVVSTMDFVSGQDFHLLPEGVVVTGLEPLRDTLLIFTTAGLWSLSGLAFDIVDDLGNPQHRLELVSRELILWGDTGITGWHGGIIAPGVDDVYLIGADGGPVPVTGGARKAYREHVREGDQPGGGAVYRGHYVLPILDPSGYPEALFVWRLDMPGVPFSQWDGHGGGVRAFTVRSGSTTRQPDLLGGVSTRLESFSGVFAPSSLNPSDADGSEHVMSVTSRSFTAGTLKHLWRQVRARTEQDDTTGDAWLAEYAIGRPGSTFTGLAAPTIRDIR